MKNKIMNIKSMFVTDIPTINCDFDTTGKDEIKEALELIEALIKKQIYTEIEFKNNNK